MPKSRKNQTQTFFSALSATPTTESTTAPLVPPNDVCTAAINLDLGRNNSGTNLGATMDTACDTGDSVQGVWYRVFGNEEMRGTLYVTACSGKKRFCSELNGF